jgi:cytochrome c peroxidase
MLGKRIPCRPAKLIGLRQSTPSHLVGITQCPCRLLAGQSDQVVALLFPPIDWVQAGDPMLGPLPMHLEPLERQANRLATGLAGVSSCAKQTFSPHRWSQRLQHAYARCWRRLSEPIRLKRWEKNSAIAEGEYGDMGQAIWVVALWSMVLPVLLYLLGPGWGHAGVSTEIGPLPPLPIPEDNPMTSEKVELGKRLFFDPRLSGDGSLACASCHLPDQGWTTKTPLSPSYPTTMERRNSQTLINIGYNKALVWDGRAGALEKQALGPIQNPLHMNQNLDLLIEKLRSISSYEERFQQVFGTSATPEALGKALAAFERTLVTRLAPFDRYMTGEWQAMSESALRGMELFKGKARCILCHNGPNFTDSQFHKLGVPAAPLLSDPLVQAAIRFDAKRMNVPEYQSVREDLGRYLVTKEEKDKGAFKTPTLRNVIQRGPYMHNAVFHSLEDIIDFYDAGGGAIAGKSPLIQPLGLTVQEKRDLLAFLQALTGELPTVIPPELAR